MVLLYHGTMVPRYHGSMVPWYHGTHGTHGTMAPFIGIIGIIAAIGTMGAGTHATNATHATSGTNGANGTVVPLHHGTMVPLPFTNKPFTNSRSQTMFTNKLRTHVHKHTNTVQVSDRTRRTNLMNYLG